GSEAGYQEGFPLSSPVKTAKITAKAPPLVDPAVVESKYLLYMEHSSGRSSSSELFTREEQLWLWQHHPEYAEAMREAYEGYLTKRRADWELEDRQRFAAQMGAVKKVVNVSAVVSAGAIALPFLLEGAAAAIATIATGTSKLATAYAAT